MGRPQAWEVRCAVAKFFYYPTRTAKDYFAVPNLIFMNELGAVSFAVYAYLRFNQHGIWFAPLVDCKKLSDVLNLREATIQKHVKRLVENDLVYIEEGYLFLKRKRKDRPWGFWLKPKEEDVRNCFLLPRELFHLGLCAGEIAVYSFLMSCENRKTYQCYPSYRTIGEAVSMSVNTVKKYVDALVDNQFIYTERTSIVTKDGRKQNGSLLYTIRPIYEAIQHHTNMQLEQQGLF